MPLLHVARGALIFACLARAVPVPSVETCTQLEVTHTNMEAADALTALEVYVDTLETAGGGAAALDRLIVSGALGRALTARFRGQPTWDIFVMVSSGWAYSIHCGRYVELSGADWNVLLCQQLVGHTMGTPVADSSSCRRGPGSGLSLFSNGSLAAPQRWHPPRFTLVFYTGEAQAHTQCAPTPCTSARCAADSVHCVAHRRRAAGARG